MKWLPLFLSLLVFTNCTGDQNPSPTITIFAASSLTNAFTELAATYEATTNTTITLSFAGSSTLAAQIIEGAPADIFASANLTQAQMIAQEMDTDDAIVFAHNRPVIALPPDNPGQINSIDDLANPNLAIVLATPGVPIRQYTDEILQKMDSSTGEGFSDAVMKNLISEEDNVRQVLAKIALGEADAGIVYQTDITDDVISVPIPDAVNVVAEYGLVQLTENSAVDDFIAFIRSETGQDILRSWGFTPIHETP